MTAGLLTLLLSTGSVGAPPSDAPTPSEEIRRRLEERGVGGSYNPIISSPAGRATVVGGESATLNGSGVGTASIIGAMGLVYEPAFSMENGTHGSPAAYEPRAGDLVFFVSDTWYWPALYLFALTGEPYHVGILVQMPDRSLGLLEAGPPEMTRQVQLTPAAERLEQYSGRVFIRHRAEPLTAEQSAALTEFACHQEGKRYAIIRFLCQGTPFRTRGPLRTEYIGKPRFGESPSYFCSELVTEALVYPGLIDAETARPRATVMEDLFYDKSSNPYIDKHLKLWPCWGAPQLWVGDGCVKK